MFVLIVFVVFVVSVLMVVSVVFVVLRAFVVIAVLVVFAVFVAFVVLHVFSCQKLIVDEMKCAKSSKVNKNDAKRIKRSNKTL